MKLLTVLFFLISFNINAQVNLSTYGAVGDGVTDDTAALQAAFNAETNLISSPNKTYLISGSLLLTQNMTHTIDFNGSTLTRNTAFTWMLYIDKKSYAGTNTTISNLEIDGNQLSGSLVRARSKIQFSNMDLHDAWQTTGSSGIIGIYCEIYDGAGVEGQWVLDDVNFDYIQSLTATGVIGTDSYGSARSLQIIFQEKVTNGVQIVYKNSTLDHSYGDDADHIVVNSKPTAGDISFTNNSTWFENLILRNAQRRLFKGFCGNITITNCQFYSAAANDPNINKPFPPAALLAIGAGSSAINGENNLVCGCTFNGYPSDPLDSWYTKVLAVGQNGSTSADNSRGGTEFRHCTFNGDNPNSGWGSTWQGLAIVGRMGEYKICDCDFTLASSVARGNRIINYGSAVLKGPKIQLDINNYYEIGQTEALNRLDSSLYDLVNLSNDCDVCPSIDGVDYTPPTTGNKNESPWEYCQDGNPIGGGDGYDAIVTSGTHTVTAGTTYSDFKTLVEARTSGDIVFINPDVSMDLTSLGDNAIYVPAGVTIASDRGNGGSEGALLYTNELKYNCSGSERPVFITDGIGVRFTGFRLKGPFGETGYYDWRNSGESGYGFGVASCYRPLMRLKWGISSNYDNTEVDNMEVSQFPAGGITLGRWSSVPFYGPLQTSEGHKIHHNYIHHNKQNTLGYGVSTNEAHVEIYANIFHDHRHDIHGSGTPDNYYEAYCNTVLAGSAELYPQYSDPQGGTHHNFDVHADGNCPSGAFVYEICDPPSSGIYVHHNDFQDDGSARHDPNGNAQNVSFGGIPRGDAGRVEYNRTVRANLTFNDPYNNGSYLIRQLRTNNPLVNIIAIGNILNGENPPAGSGGTVILYTEPWLLKGFMQMNATQTNSIYLGTVELKF